MGKKLLIDAKHQGETRIALVDEHNKLLEYDFEIESKKSTQGNIYLAKILRVEPALQAAFVNYGEDRHGFLPFNEINHDYFRIPIADRKKLDEQLMQDVSKNEHSEEDNDIDSVALNSTEEEISELTNKKVRFELHNKYKIQEVIQKNQIILVQVLREARGLKGAALTTYISIAGRYCIFMPNSAYARGISRKISNIRERKKLRSILNSLEIPPKMGLIIRTAGHGQTTAEIRRDWDYLNRQWHEIRQQTMESSAPCLIFQEGNIIMRSVRDKYSKDTENIIISGDEAYQLAKKFMQQLLPSHTKKILLHKEDQPLFVQYQLESQIDQIYNSSVSLPSGGSIVLHPTEALVAIDVNSGKSNKERNIDKTAFNTNMEAAIEIAKQVKLRSLAGLIVIDFIDMNDRNDIQQVERQVKEAFHNDKARVQINKISSFGLLEISRQRISPSIIETSSNPCSHCKTTGFVRSVESTTLFILRAIEEAGLKGRSSRIEVKVPGQIATYILNKKIEQFQDIQRIHNIVVELEIDYNLIMPDFAITYLDKSVNPKNNQRKNIKNKIVAPSRIFNKPQVKFNNQDKDPQPAKNNNHKQNFAQHTDKHVAKKQDIAVPPINEKKGIFATKKPQKAVINEQKEQKKQTTTKASSWLKKFLQ